ncbi:MAG TPA: hydroxymethylglutaryl-CoA synthase, partial [Candidatus Saccharimonadales bacterium]|nr:hydroxymethylglutaryl-CoA synthase [Candidatus Saccharimonadales bacterium]
MAGIVSYGVYIPKYRLKLSEIADVWKKDALEITGGLKVVEKSVPAVDEDSVTMAVASSLRAFAKTQISPLEIGSVFMGSESHPYAVNPSSTIVADALGIGNDYFAADLEFACKAGTAGLQVTLGLLDSNKIDYGLVIGSDTAQGRPHDILEYTACSASCSLIVGKKQNEVIAQVLETSSYSSNTPDFWRRDGQMYPSHYGRFTGEPAYFMHVFSEAKNLLAKTKLKPSDFAYCVFHMPNG